MARCVGEGMQAQLQGWLSRESVAEQARQSHASCMYVRVRTHAYISNKDLNSALCLYSAMDISVCLYTYAEDC